MTAIFKRELKAYFTSPIGYVVLALIFALSGWYFYQYNMLYGMTDLSYVFSSILSVILMLVLPVLTMRLLSDDKRQKTDQALLTAPVSLTGIVLGKFLAALLVFAIGLSITLVLAIIIATKGVVVVWLEVLGNYVGLLLLGGMIIAIGLLISSLTESQFIAALGGFLVSYSLLMVDALTTLSSASWVSSVINFLSVTQRYNNFTAGIVQYDDVVFFLSMQALFLFLTVRVLDRKRWN